MKNPSSDKSIKVGVKKSQAHYTRIRDPKGPDRVVGQFFLLVDITANDETVYIPISIASGKKPAGFVYQIEGTAVGSISTASVGSKGDGVTQVTSGTIVYSKIPVGKTATFRILIEIRGKVGKEYRIIIDHINYKYDPSDARYQKYQEEISTKVLKFK